MKSRIPFLFVLLCISFFAQANNGNPSETSESKVTATAETDYSLDRIFYDDFENHSIFVDFETITDDVLQINLFRTDKIMMEDNVTDLPGNTIYELNTGLFRKGEYTIELVTLEGVKIHKTIKIE